MSSLVVNKKHINTLRQSFNISQNNFIIDNICHMSGSDFLFIFN